MVSATVRRQQVSYVRGRGISVRRACKLLSVARSTLRYESVLAKRDAPVVGVMRELPASATAASACSSGGAGTR